MSETERLRALLDGRGVKWWPMRNGGYYEDRDTEFVIGGKKHTAHEWGDGLAVYNLTAQQAVDATLGRERHPYQLHLTGDGETWSEILGDALDDLWWAAAESCTPDQMREFREHAAALGRGECEMRSAEGSFCSVNRPVYHCECGAFCADYTDATTYHKPRYCPNCGRKVKR